MNQSMAIKVDLVLIHDMVFNLQVVKKLYITLKFRREILVSYAVCLVSLEMPVRWITIIDDK